ncbi:phosphotransferase [Roseovarius aestuarii]|nr:phosphotransferase [Roseovarius aestuarii]
MSKVSNHASEAITDVLASAAPEVSQGQAEDIAAKYFGVKGAARNLASERDTNYYVRTAEGRGYALKFANPAEPPENTNFQTEALLYLEKIDPSLPVPKVVGGIDGAHERTLTLSDGRKSVVRLLTWVEGEQVANVGVSGALRRDIGVSLARLGSALSGFDHPAAAHDILWDIKNALRLRDKVVEVPGQDLRAQVGAELDNFEANVAPRLPFVRQQVIHNDLNHYNVVVHPDSPEQVAGILDFGDMVKTALVIDVAVAASYLTSLPDNALDCVTDVVSAYHAVTPLTRPEVELVRDLIVARLVTSICITNWRASRYAENADYILRNNGPARLGMANFASLPRDMVTEHLLRACHME